MPTPTPPITFGANLKAARDRAGLTQEALAERLGFKRPTAISLWERSDHLPEPDTIDKLARAIGCAAADLMRGVITPYDVLRGSVEIAPRPRTFASADLSPLDRRWLDVGRRLTDALRRKHLTLILATLDEVTSAAAPSRSRTAPRRKRPDSSRGDSTQDRSPRAAAAR